ncbi:MAG TPA: CHRD domain-containing protein [Sphingorhabdus sp.]|nr:CHRD domain-containing protein [Sphingorhabdus sp.]
MKYSIVTSAIVTTAILGSAATFAREDSGAKLSATLDGASEVPGPGDTDGAGTAMIRINPGQGQLCYTINVMGIAPATMAHIHEAPVGAAGPVVAGLAAPTSGSSQACVAVSRELAMEIIRNPGDYYVNVHNSVFPGGAVRGQLGR